MGLDARENEKDEKERERFIGVRASTSLATGRPS
jgi:hypothetical protein